MEESTKVVKSQYIFRLHYTVKYNGKFINSQKLKLPSGKILKDEERKLFEVERIKLDVKLAELKSYKR